MKKILILLVFIASGCSNKKIDVNMPKNFEATIRTSMNEIAKIKSYNETQFMIEYDKKEFYFIDGRIFMDRFKEKEYKENVKFSDFKKVFAILENIKKIEKKEYDLINEIEYEVIPFVISKNHFNNKFKTNYKGDGKGYVYYDSEGNLYKIFFKNESYKFEIIFTNFNTVEELFLEKNDINDYKDYDDKDFSNIGNKNN